MWCERPTKAHLQTDSNASLRNVLQSRAAVTALIQVGHHNLISSTSPIIPELESCLHLANDGRVQANHVRLQLLQKLSNFLLAARCTPLERVSCPAVIISLASAWYDHARNAATMPNGTGILNAFPHIQARKHTMRHTTTDIPSLFQGETQSCVVANVPEGLRCSGRLEPMHASCYKQNAVMSTKSAESFIITLLAEAGPTSYAEASTYAKTPMTAGLLLQGLAVILSLVRHTLIL